MERYAQLFARRRWPVAAFVLIVTAAAFLGLSRLEFDDVPRGIFAGDDEEHARLVALYEEFGSDDNDALIVLESDDWFTPVRAELLRETVQRVRDVDGIDSAVAVSDVPVFDAGSSPAGLLPPADASSEAFAAARALALEHPLVAGRLLSADGRTTLVVARLRDGALSIEEIEPVVSELIAIVDAAEREEGVEAGLTGIPPIRVEIYGTIRREQVLFFVLGAALCCCLAAFLFRSAGAVVAACLPPALGALWALGFLGLVGVPVDLLGTVLPMLVIVIGLTDAVHLVIDVRLTRAEGKAPLASAVEAIRHVGLPCALTSVTTAIGFGSLALGNVPMIRRFGLSAAASVLLAFLAVVTLTPLLASTLHSVGRPVQSRLTAGWGERARRLIDGVVRHARAVAVLGTLTTLGLALVATRLEPENRLTEALPRGEAYETLLACERAFGGVLPTYVVAEWEPPLEVTSPEVLAALQDVEGLLDGLEHASAPLSIRGVLEAVPGGLERPELALALLPEQLTGRLVRPDLGRAVVVAQVPDGGAGVMVPLYQDVRAALARLEREHPDVSLWLTGTDAVARTHINRMIADLARSLGAAALIIFGVISLEFRSLRLGVVSLLPNVLPLVVVGALLFALDLPLQLSSAVLFTVLLGLAVDDTIHFLARERRELRRTGDPALAIRRSFVAVGKAILITTLILQVGFATVLVSTVPTNTLFAGMACVGLVAALAGDLILLPALLALPWVSRHRRGPGAGAPPERSP